MELGVTDDESRRFEQAQGDPAIRWLEKKPGRSSCDATPLAMNGQEQGSGRCSVSDQFHGGNGRMASPSLLWPGLGVPSPRYCTGTQGYTAVAQQPRPTNDGGRENEMKVRGHFLPPWETSPKKPFLTTATVRTRAFPPLFFSLFLPIYVATESSNITSIRISSRTCQIPKSSNSSRHAVP